MAIILAIETSTRNCSVALFKGDEIIGSMEVGGAYNHAEKLNLFIDKVFSQAGIEAKNMDAIAVGEGPGSYTGLRIGVSTVKGICYALSKPLIAINSLHTMAAGAHSFLKNKGVELSAQSRLCPMIDARRMEVYSAVFDKQLATVRETQADILEENDHYAAYIDNDTFYFFGDGAEKCKALFNEQKKMKFLEPDGLIPSAKDMGELAMKRYEAQDFEDVAYFEPFYLKEFLTTKPKKLL